MAETLKKIIKHLNNNDLNRANELCEKNADKKIQHIIFNIKGVILFKKLEFKPAENEFLKSIELDKTFIDPYKNLCHFFL